MKLGDEFFSSLSFFFLFFFSRESEIPNFYFFLVRAWGGNESLNYRPRSTLYDPHKKREKRYSLAARGTILYALSMV